MAGVRTIPSAGTHDLCDYLSSTSIVRLRRKRLPATSAMPPPNSASSHRLIGAPPVTGIVALSAVAADNVGVTLVEFFVDGVSIGGDTQAPYSVNWDSATASNGTHELLARASDEAGNTALDQALVKQLPEIAELLRSLGGEEGQGDKSRLN